MTAEMMVLSRDFELMTRTRVSSGDNGTGPEGFC